MRKKGGKERKSEKRREKKREKERKEREKMSRVNYYAFNSQKEKIIYWQKCLKSQKLGG